MGSETSCEAMEVGLHLAEFLGGIVDSNSTVCHGPTAMGIQEAGRVGRNRRPEQVESGPDRLLGLQSSGVHAQAYVPLCRLSARLLDKARKV